MRKIYIAILLNILAMHVATAQDIHFTQYFTSPLTLNPAMTGLVQGDLRLASNFRTQWGTVSNKAYTTATFSYDMAILKGKLPEGDAIGLGFVGMYDQAGTASLVNTTFGGSLAYHKAFGRDKLQHFSVGAQGFLVQKTVSKSGLKFEDQIISGSTSTIETINLTDLTYPDFNIGLMYSGQVSEHATAYAGLSYYHLTQPVETFLNDNHQIHARTTAYLGGSFDLSDKAVLYASGLYQTQASATELLMGAAFGFVMNEGHDPEYERNTVFFMGAWYRYGDALAPYFAIEWNKMRIGLSYDANISRFAPATNTVGGIELSLLFFGNINKREAAPNYSWSCPKLF